MAKLSVCYICICIINLDYTFDDDEEDYEEADQPKNGKLLSGKLFLSRAFYRNLN